MINGEDSKQGPMTWLKLPGHEILKHERIKAELFY